MSRHFPDPQAGRRRNDNPCGGNISPQNAFYSRTGGGSGGLISGLSKIATIGIGHTNATADECENALAEGAVSFTHTFNAMTALTHRGTGAAGAAMASSAYAELICDGLHVSPEAVRALYKAKNMTATGSF